MKDKLSRLTIFKVYKILCKMLDAEAICFGKARRADRREVIYAVDDIGRKLPLWWENLGTQEVKTLSIHGNAKKDDIQRAVVLRVMKAIELGDVWITSKRHQDFPVIPKGICFEELIINMDLGN